MRRSIWLEHWQDEGESAYLYEVLAEKAPTAREAELYRQLAAAEREHQALFAELLRQEGIALPPFRPRLRARLLAYLARRGYIGWVSQLRLQEEAREVRTYLSRPPEGEEVQAVTRRVMRDEAEHVAVLAGLLGFGEEPWHRVASGGLLRNVVYGFNDGLTANFGLVAGVLGAQVPGQIVLLSGLAGLLADALSMGASAYLAAKSEQEVYEHELRLEAEELRLMPEAERRELELLYQAKGMDPEAAQEAARRVMADPQAALAEKARQELGLAGKQASPLREGMLTGSATALGALIPVLPFFFGHGPVQIWSAFAVSMISHFLVGALRSFFTGRDPWRSGLDMFLVGLGVAAVGYLVGDRLVGWLF
nr:MAG: hypothetical protein KatS3mg041_2095 [Bacteroidota bacterium]